MEGDHASSRTITEVGYILAKNWLQGSWFKKLSLK